MAYQVAVRTITSPGIQVRQGNPVIETGSQEPDKVSGTIPASTVRSPTNKPSNVTVTCKQNA